MFLLKIAQFIFSLRD